MLVKDGVPTFEPCERGPPAAQDTSFPPEPAPATPTSVEKTELLVHGAGKSECNGRYRRNGEATQGTPIFVQVVSHMRFACPRHCCRASSCLS
eukprot:COSAG02_NODE_58557_length_277_cov_0.573034_1_plen_92_part_11